MITIFKSILNPDEPLIIDIMQALSRIRESKYKDLVGKIRDEPDKKKQNELKKKLPIYLFSGEFSRRANNACLKHSGYVCIDFDNIQDLTTFRKRIESDSFTFASFLSPSGKGLKVVVKIPASIETHASSVKALESYYNVPNFDSLKDIARACFDSYDPDIYINVNSLIFERIHEEKKPLQQIKTIKAETDEGVIYNNIKTWIEKYHHYQEGNRHNFLVKITGACNRFGISENITKQFLRLDYLRDGFPEKELESIVNAVYRNYSFQHNIAEFDKNEPVEISTRKKLTEQVFDITIPLKDVIYLDNIKDRMIRGFKDGYTRGETTYYPELDNHYRMMRGEVTFLGGIGNHGKTTFLLSLCLIKSIKENYKWAIFSPEQNPPDFFYNDLIHGYIGKPTDKFIDSQMTEAEYMKGLEFVKEHFYYIYPETERATPEYINERFFEVIKKHNVDGCIIDPYNQLETDIMITGGREDLYISSFLNTQKKFALNNNIFMFIIAHPKFSGLSKSKDGNYTYPGVGDYAGGAMWNNKCDNILCYHRPNYRTDPKDTLCWIISQKIRKQRLNGFPGIVEFNFSRSMNRYFQNGICPISAERFKDEVPLKSFYEVNKDDDPPF